MVRDFFSCFVSYVLARSGNMSSPSSSPSSHRKIAPLPMRRRGPSSSENSSPNVPIGTPRSIPALNVSKSDLAAGIPAKLDGTMATEYAFQKPDLSGQNLQTSQLRVENSIFTFRCLHNASPQPPRTFANPPKLPDSSPAASPPRTTIGLVSDHHEAYEVQRGLDSLSLSQDEPDMRPRSHSAATSTVSTEISDRTRPPYDIRDEPAPTAPFYTTTFQSAVRNGTGIAQEAAEALVAVCALDNVPILQRLKCTAEDLSKYRSSETRTIAVLGDSGEGKRSY